MFNNIGHKIKYLAETVCYIGIACSVIGGIIMIATDDDLLYWGILVAVIGSLVSWISTFLLYGFGELIVRVTSIDEKMRGSNTPVYLARRSSCSQSNHHTTPSALDPQPAAHGSTTSLVLNAIETDENEIEETYLDACWLEEQQRYREALQ